MPKCLVTGAGGFIGSHLAHALVRSGEPVRALVRYSSRGSFGWLEDLDQDVFNEIEIVQGDLRDSDSMDRVVQGCERVFHLGAMISIPYSYVSPMEAQAVNVQGTLNVLQACRRAQVDRLVHTSSSEVYGSAQYVPIDEKHPLVGQSPYSASKIGADNLATSFYRSYELPVVTIRPFNTFGPRQSARAIIPAVMVQLMGKQKLELGNLSPTRDFTYVTDTVAGMIAASKADGVLGQTLNLGVGEEISIGDLVRLIGETLGVDPKVEQDPRRLRPEKSEVERLCSDNRRAKELLKWEPKVSLKNGLKQTATWLKDHLHQYSWAMENYVV